MVTTLPFIKYLDVKITAKWVVERSPS